MNLDLGPAPLAERRARGAHMWELLERHQAAPGCLSEAEVDEFEREINWMMGQLQRLGHLDGGLN